MTDNSYSIFRSQNRESCTKQALDRKRKEKQKHAKSHTHAKVEVPPI
jgi:hypothetical protein